MTPLNLKTGFICLVLLAFGLPGCMLEVVGIIPLPNDTEFKYQDDDLAFIELGKTGKDELEQKLGPPHVTLLESGLLIYGERSGVVRTLNGESFFQKYNILFLQMDAAGRVSHYEIIKNPGGCLTWGPCIEYMVFSHQAAEGENPFSTPLPEQLTDIVLSQDALSDPLTRIDQDKFDNCRIIIYLSDDSDEESIRVNINGGRFHYLTPAVFLEQVVDSCAVDLTLARRFPGSGVETTHHLEFPEPGFCWIEISAEKSFRKGKLPLRLRRVDEVHGLSAVSGRGKILL